MSLDTESVERLLSARLEHGGGRPLAVAFSGGGDSLALLLLAKAWAACAGRSLVALTVDHRLQAQSGQWAASCAARAASLGVAHEALVWDGVKPARGLAAAAREARHRLIAEAARKAGARVILFGHTADDVLEAQLMRAAGVGISAPTAWSPSPVWPEGRRLFIARPLIESRRAAIRVWLGERDETWIDDPANDDLRHPRARVRNAAARLPLAGTPVPRDPQTVEFSLGPAGEITIGWDAGREMSAHRLGAAIACVAGNEWPPRRDALERLTDRLAHVEEVSATLGGARVIRSKDRLIVARETGDGRGRACRSLALSVAEPQVWDGRFEVRANAPRLTLAALRGHAARLDGRQRRAIASLHPAVRAALPALIDADGSVTCPTVSPDSRLEIRSLVGQRLFGAIGAIDREAKIGL